VAARRTTKRKTVRQGARGGRLAKLETRLPTTLREFAAMLRKRLDQLERESTRAQLEVRKRAARLLREASRQLGRLEVGGEAAWRKLGASYQKELVAMLGRLEKAVAPQQATRRKRPRARKAAASEAAVTSE